MIERAINSLAFVLIAPWVLAAVAIAFPAGRAWERALIRRNKGDEL